jgi:hypothetical protein
MTEDVIEELRAENRELRNALDVVYREMKRSHAKLDRGYPVSAERILKLAIAAEEERRVKRLRAST